MSRIQASACECDILGRSGWIMALYLCASLKGCASDERFKKWVSMFGLATQSKQLSSRLRGVSATSFASPLQRAND